MNNAHDIAGTCTLREYFASQALAGILVKESNMKTAAQYAVKAADRLIEALNAPGETAGREDAEYSVLLSTGGERVETHRFAADSLEEAQVEALNLAEAHFASDPDKGHTDFTLYQRDEVVDTGSTGDLPW